MLIYAICYGPHHIISAERKVSIAECKRVAKQHKGNAGKKDDWRDKFDTCSFPIPKNEKGNRKGTSEFSQSKCQKAQQNTSMTEVTDDRVFGSSALNHDINIAKLADG